MKLSNTYFLLRHGEAVSNKDQFVSSWPEKRLNPITEKGQKQIKRIIPKLKQEKINLIFSSDLLRTKQTAQIVSSKLKININFDKRIREYYTGIFNNRTVKEWENYFKNQAEKFVKRPPGGENRTDIKKRMASFIKDLEKKYKNKNILIVSHQDPLLILEGVLKSLSEKEIIKNQENLKIDTGNYKKIT